MSSSDAVRRFRARCAIGSPNREAARIAASARASISPLANGAFASSSNASLRSRASRSCATPPAHTGRARSERAFASSRRLASSSASTTTPVALSRKSVCASRPDVSADIAATRAFAASRFSSASRTTTEASTRPALVPSVITPRRDENAEGSGSWKSAGARVAGSSRDRLFRENASFAFPASAPPGEAAPPGEGRLVLRGGERSPSLSSSSSCIPLARGGERSSPSSSLSCLPLARGGERSSPSSSLSCLRLALGGERSAPSPSPTWLRNAPFFIATSSSSSLSCLPVRGGERSSSAASHISTFLGSSATAHPLPSSLMPRYGRVLVTLSPSTTFASTTTGPSSGFAVAGSSARFQSSTSSSRMRTPAPTCFTLTSPSVLSFFFRRFFFRASSSGAGSPPPPDTYRFR